MRCFHSQSVQQNHGLATTNDTDMKGPPITDDYGLFSQFGCSSSREIAPSLGKGRS